MAVEITEERKYNIGTTIKPKYRVFDLNQNSITLSSATYRLYKKSGGDLIDSGNAPVNNSDTDAAGQTIQTVQPTIDLDSTDVDVGEHWLSIKVELGGGESDVFRQLIEIVDFER